MPSIKLAIIGAGPSAFYVASRLFLGARPSAPIDLRIHMYDRLWAPHGLVRYGVAPDHPEVKKCTNKFDEVAADPRFRFFGNVNIGESPSHPIPHAIQVPISALFPHYTHLLFATGCTLSRLHPAIPPSPYCIPALSVVHWYTQHPSKPPAPPLDKLEHITLIGHGNVSLDVARILLSSPDHLKNYDLPKPVLDVLMRSSIKHISIIGRRGPSEVSFTAKELREMLNLEGTSMVPIDPSILTLSNASPSRQQSRLLQLLRNGSRNAPGTTKKSWSLEFFRSPMDLAPPTLSAPTLTLSLAHTTLDPTSRRAVPTGVTSTLSTSLVVTSLGFYAEPTPVGYDPALGHLRTVANRVCTASGTTLRNVYASGWAAMGAKGVLASTLLDATDTAYTILSDAVSAPSSSSIEDQEAARVVLNPDPDMERLPPKIHTAVLDGAVTSYEDWKKVDAEEARRGKILGKERERMSWEDAISFLRRV